MVRRKVHKSLADAAYRPRTDSSAEDLISPPNEMTTVPGLPLRR